MRAEVDEVLDRCGGVASRAQLTAAVGTGGLDDEIRRGRLTRVFRRTYCRPWEADQTTIRERAALVSLGAPARLTHLTALRRWDLLDAPDDVHASIPDTRLSRPQPGLQVHRVHRLPPSVLLDGLPTARVAPSLVASWPLLPLDERRGPAISAVRKRLMTPTELADEVAASPKLAGRRELATLGGLLADGCESELEIWGCLGVFDVPGLRHGVRQRMVVVDGMAYRLDLAFDDEMVAIEMDGDRWHSTRESRDRDRRRDAALATLGWLTLRFSFDRLHHDVSGCRRDALRTLATRRR